MAVDSGARLLAVALAGQGGTGGTTDYSLLENKPKINNVELNGNKSLTDLGITIPTKTSDLTNDSNFITSADITGKQDTLTAGTNITIVDNVISASGGGATYTAEEPITITNNKIALSTDTSSGLKINDSNELSIDTINYIQSKLTAGNNITITDNVISATDTKYTPILPLYVDTGELRIDLGNGVYNNGGVLEAKPSTGIIVNASGISVDTTTIATVASLTGKANVSDLATVATSGSYNDLSDKPTIPTVPTNVSAFTNDSGYITSADITGKQDKLTAGSNITIVDNVISASGGGSEPSAYIKSASTSGNTLTLTNKDDTTVTFTPNTSIVTGVNDGTNWTSITIDGTTKAIPSGGSGSSYTAGNGINISNNEISADTSVVATVASLADKENSSNKVTSISSSSTDSQYPSAKCVYDMIGNVEITLGGLL